MMAPYRSAPSAVLARFPLRSYPSYVIAIGVSLIAVLLVFMGMRAAGLGLLAEWAALVAAAAIPFWIVRRIPDYRVAGGAGEIRVFRDRVEIPHPSSREPIRMPLGELRVQVPTRTYVRNGVKVRESQSLILSTRTHQRVLDGELFLGPDEVRRAASVIRRLQRGLEIDPRDLDAADEDPAHAFERQLAPR